MKRLVIAGALTTALASMFVGRTLLAQLPPPTMPAQAAQQPPDSARGSARTALQQLNDRVIQLEQEQARQRNFIRVLASEIEVLKEAGKPLKTASPQN